MWLDTRDASSWDRNPADFTSVGYLTLDYRNRLLERSINEKSFVFTRISQPAIPHSSAQPVGCGGAYT